jgi:hypothetical protein
MPSKPSMQLFELFSPIPIQNKKHSLPVLVSIFYTISSAKIPFALLSCKVRIHVNPSCWYVRKVARNKNGIGHKPGKSFTWGRVTGITSFSTPSLICFLQAPNGSLLKGFVLICYNGYRYIALKKK